MFNIMVVSILSKSAGFYSQFFFVINHYLYAKKYNYTFFLKTDDWLFKYIKGWEDYFLNIDISSGIDTDENYGHHQDKDEFTITEYKNAIKEMYRYNDDVKNKINEIKQNLSLKDNYDAIFIRRGDKLVWESVYISTESYIKELLLKNPECHTIFVQTDDYNCYLDVKKYVEINNLKIDVVTLCKEQYKGGMVVYSTNVQWLNGALTNNENNKEYISTVIDSLEINKPVGQFNNYEIYEHTIEMLIGIDIVLSANIVICDYSSNVSRFIKLANKNSDNVFDVNHSNQDINWNNTICPAYELLF